MKHQMHVSWKEPLQRAFETDRFAELAAFLEQEYQERTVFPPQNELFSAFHLTPFEDVKVLILGQDPYHGPGQAHGLSFSVRPGVRIPPSLRNMYKELASDLGIEPAEHGDLTHWAKSGVMMLNTILTVRAGEAASHQKKGWEEFTDLVITALSEREQKMVFVLWGAKSAKKARLIDEQRHAVITGVHPSPLSAYRGFFGSKVFSEINSKLAEFGEEGIDWRLPEREG